jgi:hypothetical protein
VRTWRHTRRGCDGGGAVATATAQIHRPARRASRAAGQARVATGRIAPAHRLNRQQGASTLNETRKPASAQPAMRRWVDGLTRFMYIVAGLSFTLISLLLIAYAVWEVLDAIYHRRPYIDPSLDAIGLIVVSIAVFDIAKYLYEEQIVYETELRSAREARETLTKFLVIIVIAVALEALVFIFRTGTNKITELLYPTGLLVAAVILVVGLGWYQKLSSVVEQEYRGHPER